MTQEEKELLLKDLCARLPYRVKIYHKSTDISGKASIYDGYILHEITSRGDGISLLNLDKGHGVCEVDITLGEFKPYLRPMSSMTEEEEGRYNLCQAMAHSISEEHWTANDGNVWKYSDAIDYLNEHHFDYRGLIEKGLALEAPEGMYKF